MPIELFTGLPGNGKTLLMVERLMQEAEAAQRPIIAAGIDGLKEGVATVLDDPRKWNDHDPDGEPTCDCHGDGKLHAHRIPDGSLIFVDEAWKWFGHLHDATRQSTPPHVLALAEHRHRGIDFVWTTQMPVQLYPFARSLIQNHHHVVRRFGTQLIDVFTWQELCEDVKSQPKREAAIKKTRMLPKEHFGDYKSATLHTIKRKIPFRVLMLPVLLVAGAGCAFLAYRSLKPSNMAAKYSGAGSNSALAESSQAGSAGQGSEAKPRFRDKTDYTQQHLPRFVTMPWTAPVFDERQVTADPRLFCMSSNPGPDASGEHQDHTCTCITEQGSYYELEIHACRHVARRGEPYNPYRQQQEHQQASMQPEQGQPQARVMPGVAIGRSKRSMGTFPESPSYSASSSVTPPTSSM